MTEIEQKYRDFWKDQTSPLHRHDDEKAFRAYASELKNLFHFYGTPSGRVLEIGCGNGALYPHLDFDESSYTGFDLSDSLIKIFRERHPTADVSVSDCLSFDPSGQYSLVFGNAVHQHFSETVLKAHLEKFLPYVQGNGIYAICNLPFTGLRQRYLRKEFTSASSDRSENALDRVVNRCKAHARASFRRWFGDDSIGYWYSPEKIRSMIGKDYALEIHGSNFYPYRIHVMIHRRS
ncbi:MAG: class I SAM-dependent methyltransferase [Pseudomonadota bacterium]